MIHPIRALTLSIVACGLPIAAAAQSCGGHCGTERWAVKTFTDADTGRVDLTPRAGTVAELRAFSRPISTPEERRTPLELRTYRVHALLLGWKHERDDDDYHLVIADPAHPDATMIVEIPSPACARVCSSRLVAQMGAARRVIERELGRPSGRFRRLAPPRMVTITGLLFFDFLHGQTGVAPNGVELHPVTALAFDGASSPPPEPPLATVAPHTRVDIGGRHLDVMQAGSGGPAVVMEVGLADSLETWAPVWPAVARFTTVVTYSRAGFGRSDPSPDGYSARHAAEDLHALLHRLPIRPPYILVGRSYGGLLVRLYTSLYPADVAGIVLVDGTHERQVKRYGEIDSTYPAAFRTYFDSMLATMPAGPQAAEIRETVRIQAAGAVDGLTPLPDIPIAVITSMRADTTARYVNGTARGHEVWRALHDEWFHRSTNGIHIETTRSGHDIQESEPELVVSAIRFVFDRVRTP